MIDATLTLGPNAVSTRLMIRKIWPELIKAVGGTEHAAG